MEKLAVHQALTCDSQASLMEIAKKLKTNNERRIFVVDSGGKLKGIISTTDIVYKSTCEGKTELKAEDIMTKKVKSIDVSEDLQKALKVMEETKSLVCPVTENGAVIGTINYPDLIKYLMLSEDKNK